MTSLITEGLLTLWQLDTSPVKNGGQTLYFTSASADDPASPLSNIVWGGITYYPVPMEASGFEMSTKGTPPQPSVAMSNLFGAGNLLLADYNGLIGALLVRIQTLRRFLDDGATPDANAYITREKFAVAQKTSHTAAIVVFKLAALWDMEGTQLPRRQILRDVCSHTYRVWRPDLGAFDYSKASCPYTGGLFWDAANNPTDAAHDQCRRDIDACRNRFGFWSTLPARFFPGVGRVK